MSSDLAVIKATLSDWRTVKGRKQLQLIFEVPLEQQKEVLTRLGAPDTATPLWCAIALLDPEKAQEQPKDTTRSEVAKKAYRDMTVWKKAATRAVMLCKDERFRDWLRRRQGNGLPLPAGEAGGEAAAYFLREACNIESRSEIATDERAYTAFIALEQEYRMATGQAAEVRG